jgi:DNA-binding beta-propeller fold protein YncE
LTSSLIATGSSPSSVIVDPFGQFAYVSNETGGTFSAFVIAPDSGTLTVEPGSPFPAGGSPRALALDPSGHTIYIANSTANTLTGINGLPVNASVMQSPIMGSPYATGSIPVSIAVEPVDGFVYVANQGSNDVSAFKLSSGTGSADGVLTALAGSPFAAGVQPSSVVVDPTGKFAYVANSGSGTVSAYEINATSGALSALSGSPFAAGLLPSAVAVSD